MEQEEVPQETPEEPVAEAEGDEGNQPEVDLSQKEDEQAEAEPAAEAEGEPEAKAPEGDEYELPRGVQKRIDKLTAQKKALAEEKDKAISDLRQEIDELRASKESPDPKVDDPSNPYRHLQDLETIRREELNAETVLDWCDDHPDGAVVHEDGNEREYSVEDIREIRKRARKALNRQLPEQRKWVEDYAATEPYVEANFPWWADKATAEYQAARQIMKEFPEVMRFPGYKVSVGDIVEGMKVRMARQEEKAKGRKKAAPPKAPEQPVAPVAEPAPVNETAARSAAARQRFSETGTIDDLANVMAAAMD
tara:strand:+ start:815 stop:1738 length:924 start_codon:yes stop_codon:yes gene_type:complete